MALNLVSTKDSQALWQKKERYVPRAVSPLAPFIISEGRGAIVRDLEGREYIDLTGGWGCLNVGYSHPRVVRAIQEQAAKFTHTDCSVIMYDVYIELAERLSQLAPGPSPKKAIFFNSGAEAVENAVKIARSYTKRKAVVVFDGAFHGRTFLALSMTHKAKPYKEHFAPFASDIYRMPFPNPYRHWMDFKHWERQLLTLVNPDEIACVVFEPIQGEGGFIVPQEGFLKFLREFTHKHGIVLVADEIQTGIGRTGKFYAYEHFGIEPDLITLAKSLAAGMPLSAVVGVQRVMDAPGEGAVGGTYVGNPVACAAALAVLDIVEEERLLERAVALGDYMRSRFLQMQKKYALIGDVRGLGAMIAIELVKDRQTKEPASEETLAVIQECLAQGVLIAKAGLYGNVIRMLIPLVIQDAELKRGLDAIESAIAKVSR
ncbi:MAG: 4-aminobutyrate--2-oxoglutarate transaminase [Candidatus Bipolaricaulota bacterium]|nr:4-aminobutyrate--2-oxoglutarate transaminase [Candidatus Bipolaricaulota bacterium]MCS7275118.1 4-aminobutyrate--2-oxoglutarate transaminase [Candidatus Bipolaricaulota bacterium]MDW8111192.1 4-aminobutyrate--2-oxoglutarate transaminase [Candidatus Bipolaricaulota bacterium]MDW8329907.1 4-aminobutyrate--2-oxoglutarate transaminase [Candidatus Bipolaricaulota bacterium]